MGRQSSRRRSGPDAVRPVGCPSCGKEAAIDPEAWPLAGVMFLGLGYAILLAVDGWMAALEALFGRGIKGTGVAVRAVLAVLYTALAVGAWYALAFVVLPHAEAQRWGGPTREAHSAPAEPYRSGHQPPRTDE